MTANRVQASRLQQLAASTTSRRRSVPPSPPEPVSQSLNQRWRERPRCPAPTATRRCRDGVVHAIVGRVSCRRLRTPSSRRTNAPPARTSSYPNSPDRTGRRSRTEISSRACLCFPEETLRLRVQILASHHRAFHAGAVLGVVNALRFASTRPTAGPSGIDDASARHDLGFCAMAGLLVAPAGRENEVDAGFRQAYVDVSRLCRMAHLPHRTQCMRSAFPVVALRARFKRTPKTSRSAAAFPRCA